MQYRKLKKIDAERFWEMLNQLDHETEYMLYEPGERTKNIARMEAVIENSATGNDFLLAAEVDGKIVGYIWAQRGNLNRIVHSAYIVCGILKNYRGQGIGTEFFKQCRPLGRKRKHHAFRINCNL